jgi:hypothetical protein
VTTPSLPGLPSDKLIPPLNAAPAGNVSPGIQPGTTGNIVLAQYVIVFGASGGWFIYDGTPAPGNAPIYWGGNVSADPYGNALTQGIWAGQPGSIQIGIQTSGPGPTGSAIMYFVPVGSYAGDAAIGMQQEGGQAIMVIQGAQTAPNPAANSDRILIALWDHGGGSTAAFTGFYNDTGGTSRPLFDGNCAGMSLYAVQQFAAVDPTTGASPSAAFQPETWHNITLDSGWTVAGGETPQYRLLPGGNVQLRGDISHAGTTAQTDINSGHPLGAGYQPAAARYYRPPQAADFAGAVQANPTGIITMRASGFTATQAILDGIYSL